MSTAEEEQGAGIPEWVVTFGDMMSLLLTFFIMLFSMSEIKEEQLYQAVLDALHKRFGFEASTMSMIPGDIKPRNSALAKMASLGRARRANTMNGGDKVRAPVGEHPRVRTIRNGEQVTIGGVIYLRAGTWELTAENHRTLRAIAREIGGKPQKIEIRGHTSTQPLAADSPFKDHWELAHARCRQVMDFLVKIGMDAKRMRMVAAADNEAVHIGSDPLLQKRNSRVEIFLLNELVRDLEGTAEEKRSRYYEP